MKRLSRKTRLRFDEIGYWSEIKLDIVKDYATEYSKILAAQNNPCLNHVYIDAFAGAGVHISKMTREYILGSHTNALNVKPPFREYHFIDINRTKIALLKRISEGQQNVYVYEGDCNDILLEKVFPRVKYEDYRRGLCLLDPYGLHLNWKVIQGAGQMGTIDLFLNFPVADINRNVLWHNPEGVDPSDIERMNAFWGDNSWRSTAYTEEQGLFGFVHEKVGNEKIAMTFRERLSKIAKFKHVVKPLPMRNSSGSIVYYLFFASQKPVATDIVEYIFNKYQERGLK